MHNGKTGFTLIELLVVIAIIVLLVSILVPSLKKAKELASIAVCLTQLRNAGQAIQMYGMENDDEAVPVLWLRSSGSWPGPEGYPPNQDAYFSDAILLGQFTSNQDASARHGRVPDDSIWRCPSDKRNADQWGNYVGSYAMFAGIDGWPTPKASTQWASMFRLSAVRAPGKMLAFLDSTIERFHPGFGDNPPFFANTRERETQTDTWGNWSYGVPNSYYNYNARHGGEKANVVFADGHAATFESLFDAHESRQIVLRHNEP